MASRRIMRRLLKGNGPRYLGDPLSPAFVSNMHAEDHDAAPRRLGVCSHPLFDVDNWIRATRVIVHQSGYVVECGIVDFRPAIIEIG